MIDWSTYDEWHLKTKAIVLDTGAKQPTVSKARKRWAPESVRGFRYIDWASVDWYQDTSDIAEQTETTETQVSKARNIHAKETVRHKKKNSS